MSVAKWIVSHKTRITGYLTMIAGYLTVTIDPLRDFLTQREISGLLILAGLVTTLCGHANASQSNAPPAE